LFVDLLYIINKVVIGKAFGQWCRNFNWT